MEFADCLFDAIHFCVILFLMLVSILALSLGSIVIIVLAVALSKWWLAAFLLHPIWVAILIWCDRNA